MDAIKIDDDFAGLIGIDEESYEQIVTDMKANKFDHSTPLIVWAEEDVLIDGHQRLKAAKKANIAEVPVVRRSFASREDASDYAIRCQTARRNLTGGDLLKLFRKVHKPQTHGGARRGTNKQTDAIKCSAGNLIKANEVTAKILNVSPTTAGRLAVIDKHPEIAAKVEANEISLTAGAEAARAASRTAVVDEQGQKLPLCRADRTKAGLNEAKKLIEAAIVPLDNLANHPEIIKLLKDAIEMIWFRLKE